MRFGKALRRSTFGFDIRLTNPYRLTQPLSETDPFKSFDVGRFGKTSRQSTSD
jgi:hypothetical protein